MPRPTHGKGLSEGKFLHFKKIWKRSKKSANLRGDQQVSGQLLLCYNDELAKVIYIWISGTDGGKDEMQVLKDVRCFVIVSENHLVNIVRVQALIKASNEPVQNFIFYRFHNLFSLF